MGFAWIYPALYSCIRNHLTFKVIAFGIVTSLFAIIAVAWIGINAATRGVETHTELHMESVAHLKGDALETWADSLLATASTYVAEHAGHGHQDDHSGLAWRGVAILEPSDSSVRRIWGSAPFAETTPKSLVRGSNSGPVIKIVNEIGQPGFVAVADHRVELSGVLAVFVDAAALIPVMAPDSGLGDFGQVRLVDPEAGITWIFSDGASRLEGTGVGGEDLSDRLRTIDNRTGPSLLAVTVPIPGQSIWTTAAISRQEAFSDLSNLKFSIIGGGLIALLLAVILSTILGRGITAPLRRLMESVARLQIDSVPTPIPVGSQDEIGLLTRKFNEISAELYHSSKELVIANQGLLAANESKNQFLSTVTHELKTPLTSVIAFAELLVRRQSNLTERQVQHVEAIQRNGRQLEMLIDDLLDISRIQSGNLRLELERVSLTDILREVLESMDPIFRRRGQEIAASLPDGEMLVNGDTSRIVQIMSNLLSNASKYSPERSNITVSLAVDEKTLKVSVADSGIGISDADQQRLFTPFFRVDNVQTKSVSGTGLGLVISRRLAELHGGNVTMKSELGRGSEFTVMLPRLLPIGVTSTPKQLTATDAEDAA